MIKKDRELYFVVCVILFATLVSLLLTDLESTVPDAGIHISLANDITYGEYSRDFSHRAPVVPSIVALFLFLGLDFAATRLLVQILFMNLGLLVTYFFVKQLYKSTKLASLATLFMLSFPVFLTNSMDLLTDVPLMFFTVLFVLAFYKGVEEEKKHLKYAAVLLVLCMLTKKAAILLVVAGLIYIVLRKKHNILKTREAITAAGLGLLLYILVFAFFSIFFGASFENVAEHGGLYASLLLSSISLSKLFELLLLGFSPTLALTLFGISIKDKRDQVLLVMLAVFCGFFIFVNFHLRYLIPLFPFFAVFFAKGYENIESRVKDKKIAYTLVSVLLLTSFINSVYYVNLNQERCWGQESLLAAINRLPEGSSIETDTVFTYLDLAKQHEIKSFKEEFSKDSDYIVLSLNREAKRQKKKAKYAISYLMIEIPFIKYPYSEQFVLPNISFDSELYHEMEGEYQRAAAIKRGGRELFIIYRIQ